MDTKSMIGDGSIGNPFGWSIWCSASCAGGTGGNICYKGLTQSFSTIMNQRCTISFWY